jgi:hypothetical protein
VPPSVAPVVVTVNVLVPEPVSWVGLKPAVAPPGRPLALRLTAPLNPPVAVTVMVEVVLDPALIVGGVVAEIEKSTLFTTSEATVVWICPVSLVPTIVRE